MSIQLWTLLALMGVAAAFSVPFMSYPDYSDMVPDIDYSEQKETQTKIVESFRVRSDIRYRFATTQMSSVVRNVDSKAQEIGFDVTLPKEAFIVAFHMTIDGKRYDGEVKERLQAKREYQAAVDRGQSAGHVRQAPRHANVFEVSVNVAAGSAVNFTLTYQEMLRRRLGIYEHEIHVSPGQPVQDFLVEVKIRENRPLKFVKTPALRTDYLLGGLKDENKNELAIVDRPTPETASVLYQPSVSQQGGDEDKGLSARFAVQYDVEHGDPKGDVLVVDGYFVHFMAPDNLAQTLPKDIIFVLDVSGSMSGVKINQLKVAMATILADLMPKDRFNIIIFSSSSSRWKEGLVKADKVNIDEAQSYVQGIQASGMTNINDALLTALSEMKGRLSKERVGMIFFLTDGLPTEGEQDPARIASNILNANERNVAIFSLAFGNGADYESLKSLSAQNLGFARKIYEASDAALQVSSLYKEISAVSIKDLSIEYQNSTVDEFTLTQTDFPIIFKGSEIMVCGMLENDSKTLKYEISGIESLGSLDILAEVDDTNSLSPDNPDDILFTGPRDFSGFVERMWAYQTIRQLLEKKVEYAEDKSKVLELEEKILAMSLKYKFVTPLTSMVVTKPDNSATEVLEKDLQELSLEDNDPFQNPVLDPFHQSNSRNFYPSYGQHNAPMFPAQSQSHLLPAPASYPYLSMGALSPMGPLPRRIAATRRTNIQTTSTPKTIKTTLSPAASTTTPSTPAVQLNITSTYVTQTSNSTTPRASTMSSITSIHGGGAPVMLASLRLVTLTLQQNANISHSVCMVPRKWKYGNIILLSGTDSTRVVLKQCSKRRCPSKPSLESLMFESVSDALEIGLGSSGVKTLRNSRAFNMTFLSNKELLVSGPGLTATIDWTQKRHAAHYQVRLTTSTTGPFSGLMGNLISMPEAQLEKLARKAKKFATRVCRAEPTDFSIAVYNKKARRFSVHRARKARRGTQ
ncbi:inter-alpha-trypsin inhibitor heavy chain h3 [Plakobranchus ocellatus]|uniref:Inter-alpha-trypsin inhibitor heavy chain h3 n=1 Tax=Plakobranchus ocellatus TaxID=259542 RepID=A0AAV4DFI9_9GAST|nr:inter-alpha-trypsin inhibitor heavy chain h3 [Plakobranchus ocellatus]